MRVAEDTGKYPLALFDFAIRTKTHFYGVSMFGAAIILRHQTGQNLSQPFRRATYDRVPGGVHPSKGAFDGMVGFIVRDCTVQYKKIAVIRR